MTRVPRRVHLGLARPGCGYEVGFDQMAVLQMGMIRYLADQGNSLDATVEQWLGLKRAVPA